MVAGAPLLSLNETEFVRRALLADVRIDGRRPLDARRVEFTLGPADGAAEVLLGHTRVLAVTTAELVRPFPDRPSEGSVHINVEFSAMASPEALAGGTSDQAIELSRLLEKGLRDSKAVDTEGLCVQVGRCVWAVRLDVHVLDDCGNVSDAAMLASLAALMSFRRPQVTVGPAAEPAGASGRGADGAEISAPDIITVHSPDVKEALPLHLHLLPVPVSFGYLEAPGDPLLLDPTWKEEAAMAGKLTVLVTAGRELCAMHKPGGLALAPGQISRCIRLAAARAAELTEALRAALAVHETARIQARIRRH